MPPFKLQSMAAEPRLWRSVRIRFVLVEQVWNMLIFIKFTPGGRFCVNLGRAALYKRRIRGPFMALAFANMRSSSS